MDVFDEPYWNLMQTLVWIYLRDPVGVRRAADGREEVGEASQKPPGPLNLEVRAAYALVGRGVPAFGTLAGAKRDLMAKLLESKLTVLGCANNKGDPKIVLQEQLAYLKFIIEGEDGDRSPHAGPIDDFRSGATRYFDLKFKSSEVKALWPDPLETALETIGPGGQDQNGDGAEAGPQPDAAPQEVIEASSPDLEQASQEAAEATPPEAVRAALGAVEPVQTPEAETLPGRREQRKAATTEKYRHWCDEAQEVKIDEQYDHPLKPSEIAGHVATRCKDGKPDNIKRRLNEHYPGWADYNRTGRK